MFCLQAGECLEVDERLTSGCVFRQMSGTVNFGGGAAPFPLSYRQGAFMCMMVEVVFSTGGSLTFSADLAANAFPQGTEGWAYAGRRER